MIQPGGVHMLNRHVPGRSGSVNRPSGPTGFRCSLVTSPCVLLADTLPSRGDVGAPPSKVTRPDTSIGAGTTMRRSSIGVADTASGIEKAESSSSIPEAASRMVSASSKNARTVIV